MAYIQTDGTIQFDRITQPVEVQANYLASRRDGFGVDDGISIYTGLMPWNWDWKYWKTEKWWKVWKLWGNPGVSHTSVGYWLDGKLWFFSSTSRKELGGKNGTRWIKASVLLRNPERWKLQEKNIEKKSMLYGLFIIPEDLIAIRISRANLLIGLGYDFYGVGADFVSPHPVTVAMRREARTIQLAFVLLEMLAMNLLSVLVISWSPLTRVNGERVEQPGFWP